MKKEVKKIECISFLTPDYIYIPFNKEEDLCIPRNKYIHCESNIGNDYNIFSSVSGSVLGIKKMNSVNGEVNSLVVANDYMDKRKVLSGGKKNISKYTKTELISLLKAFHFYKDFSNKKYLIIYINFNKYNITDSILLNSNIYNFLDTADAISSIYNIENVIFMVNKKDDVSKDILSKYMGSFINFSISETLKSYSKIINKSSNMLLYTANDIFEIYNVLKYKRYTKEKYISVCVKKELKSVYTKLNISLEELLTVMRLKTVSNNIKIVTSSSEIKVTNRDFIINKDVESIIID
jgi:hypothetical protein